MSVGGLELTTRFTPITTGAGAKKQQLAHEAVAAGVAHLRYITRPKAASEIAWAGTAGESEASRHEALRARMRERSQAGGKGGARVAEKGIVSLPNSWPMEARQEAVERLAVHLAPPGSEAMALVVSHRDRPGNSHLHFLAIDGRESVEAARRRRPDAKRVRRANVIRLGDRGRPKELRREIAALLNQIATERGLDGVEWRSFQDRGIGHQPTLHEGPTHRAGARKAGTRDVRAEENARRVEARGTDELDEFFYSEGTPLDLSDFDEPAKKRRQEPNHSSPQPPSLPKKRENIRFQSLRKRLREWVLSTSRGRPPRSR